MHGSQRSLLVQRPNGSLQPVSKGAQIAAAVATVLVGLAWLISAGTAGEGTFRYYNSVAEYLAHSPEGAARGDTRVHGFVVEGSIAKDLAAGHVDFAIADAEPAGALQVRLRGIDIPDLFRDGAEVVVEGRLAGGTFLADRVMAKCPSKYEAQV